MTKKHEPCLVALKFWKKHCPYPRDLSTGAREASTLATPVTAEGASPSCTHTGIRHTGQSGSQGHLGREGLSMGFWEACSGTFLSDFLNPM